MHQGKIGRRIGAVTAAVAAAGSIAFGVAGTASAQQVMDAAHPGHLRAPLPAVAVPHLSATAGPNDLGYPAWTGFLQPGDVMHQSTGGVRQELISVPGQAFSLSLGFDGNLFERSETTGRIIWQTGTRGTGEQLVFQRDHNVVLYSSTGKALWATRTFGTGADEFGVLATGNFIAATKIGNAGGNKVNWISNTARTNLGAVITYEFAATADVPPPYEAVMQGDGNFVIYKYTAAGTTAIWATRTAGNPGSLLVERRDGDLAIYAPSGAILWSSHSARGHDLPNELVMQRDGNLVLYTTGGRPLWASNTRGR